MANTITSPIWYLPGAFGVFAGGDHQIESRQASDLYTNDSYRLKHTQLIR